MDILSELKGGDLRSIGRANEIVDYVNNDQKLLDQVILGIFNEDPIIRMRAADVAEKVSKKYPKLLEKHKQVILDNLPKYEQQEVKWHIALMLSYFTLTYNEAKIVFSTLAQWAVRDKSNIVRVNAMQVMADISIKYPQFKSRTVALIKDQIIKGSASVKNRGMKLLKYLS